MKKDEVITITYTASVDFSKDTDNDGKITADQTKNTVTVGPEDDPHKSEYSHEITYKSTKKSGGTDKGTTADGDKILEWTITYNELAVASVADDTITDTIAAASTAYMKYYGDGITVKVYDKNGELVDTRDVAYENLTHHSDSSWTYAIPDTDTTPYKYVITYQTIVDMEKVNGEGNAITVNNNANGIPGKPTGVVPDNQVKITKEVESSSTQEITWVSTIEVPEGGLDKAVVTDTLPNIWSINLGKTEGYSLFDVLKGDVEVTGTVGDESYTIESITDPVDNLKKVVITFYKDADKTQPGLTAVAGGHIITVRLTTTVNQEWLEAGYDYPTSYQSEHINTININGGTDVQARVRFVEEDMEKAGEDKGNGVYKYTIKLSNVSESPIIVNDTFDTDVLEVDVSKESTDWNKEVFYISGGDDVDHIYSGDSSQKVNYTETATGIQITANSVPKKASGEYYPAYMITYFLKLKEGVDLNELAIENGGEYELKNTAKWGDHESSYSFKTTYDVLNKKLLNEGAIGGTNRDAEFEITYNPSNGKLNGGEDTVLTDTLSQSLAIDASTISIVAKDKNGADVSISYRIDYGTDEDGNPATLVKYTIPDETSVVITYTAKIMGTGEITIKNVASTSKYTETVIRTKEMGAEGEGTASLITLKVLKVDGYNHNKKLAGVKFKFYAADGRSVGEGAVKTLYYTTGADGTFTITSGQPDDKGVKAVLYGDVLYKLEEIEAAPDYDKLSGPYSYTFTYDANKVDHQEKYIYYFNDTTHIENWPLEGLIVEKEVVDGSEADLTKEFTFKVTAKDAEGNPITGQCGDDTFGSDGTFTFTLKSGQRKMFWGFKKGTQYTVEEILTGDDGNTYTTQVTYDVITLDEDGNVTGRTQSTDTATSHEGTLTSGSYETVHFTNKKKSTGSLKLKKVVTVNGEATTGTLADGDYTFTVVGPASAAEAGQVSKTVVITIENGVTKSATIDGATATIGTDGYVEVTGLAAGDYTITETAPTNGTSLTGATGGKSVSNDKVVTVTVVAGQTADAVAGAGKASFTNDYETVNLGVTKAWEPVSAAQGSVTLTLYKGDAEAAAETVVDTITLDGTADASAADVTGVTGATKQEDSVWHAQFSGLPKYEYVAGTDGAAGTLKQVYYVVKEASVPSGFAVSYTTSDGGTATYAVDGGKVTNTKKKGALKLTKLVTVNSESTTTTYADDDYTFTIAGPNSYSETVVITVTNGKAAKYKVGSGTATDVPTDGYVVIGDLTPGEYTITEVTPTNGTTLSEINGSPASGYNAKVTVVAGDTTAAEASASFTNNLDYGSLRITKSVTVNGEATTGTLADGTYTFAITDADKKSVKDVTGKTVSDVTITITNGVSSTAEVGLLAPGTYTITEAATSTL